MMINATCARTPRHPLHVKEKAKLIGYNAQNASTGSTCKYLHCNILNKGKELKNWKASVTFSHPTWNSMNISKKLEIAFLKF